VRDSVASISTERPYLINPIDIFSTFIPIVTQYDSLPNGPLNQLIQQKQHNPKEIQSLTHELLTLFILEHIFNRELHEHSSLDLVYEIHQCFIIGVDGFEYSKKIHSKSLKNLSSRGRYVYLMF
jgi:hypothetical protein